MFLLVKIYTTLLLLSIMGAIGTPTIKGIVDKSKYYTIDSISDFSTKCLVVLGVVGIIVMIGFMFYFIWS